MSAGARRGMRRSRPVWERLLCRRLLLRHVLYRPLQGVLGGEEGRHERHVRIHSWWHRPGQRVRRRAKLQRRRRLHVSHAAMMNSTTWFLAVFVVTAGAMLATVSGCEFITKVDRSKLCWPGKCLASSECKVATCDS